MTFCNIKQIFNNSPLMISTPRIQGSQIVVEFSHDPPQEPGVYVVYLRKEGIPFYVGESRNLRQRLKFLFRCHRGDNPHPCHRRHQDVWECLPDCETFCEMYGVRWQSTAGAFGRLEAEEELQKQLGTNRKEYYGNFGEIIANAAVAVTSADEKASIAFEQTCHVNEAVKPECCETKTCGHFCPVWNELTINPSYQGSKGFQVQTMTGRKEDLLFSSLPPVGGKTVIRVRRASGNLNFTFDENDCRTICERFEAGLRQGNSFVAGGTAFFNNPSWKARPLSIITAPYAAAIVRYARQKVGLRIQ